MPFYPPHSPKSQNFKKMIKKKHLPISSFYKCVPKVMIRCYAVPGIWCATDGQTDGKSDR